MEKNIIGIDVSKKYFDSVINGKVHRFDNDSKGIKKFIKSIPLGSHCAMESTSTYGYKLVYGIQEGGSFAYVINPLKIKYFAKMGLSKTKTDAIDASLIKKYATLVIDELVPYEFPSENLQEGKQILTLIDQLKKQRTALRNNLEFINYLPLTSKDAIKSLKILVTELNKQIKTLEDKVSRLVCADYTDMVDNIKSIKGVGVSTAILLVAKTNGFKDFETSNQLASFFGCCPRVIESGSSVRGRRSISKIGHKELRTRLYLCALSAKKCNGPCKELYDRLVLEKGKPKKLALMAVANKLLKQIFAIAKLGELYYSFS